jgi:hypothetical protein
MAATLPLADAVLVTEARRRLAHAHEGLGALDREARRAVRQRLVEAWRELEAVETGETSLDAALERLAALEELAPPAAVPEFRPTFQPLRPRLLRRVVRDSLIEATFDRYAHRIDVGAFVTWLFSRLPEQAVRAFEAGEQGPRKESPREEFELVWKRPKRGM